MVRVYVNTVNCGIPNYKNHNNNTLTVKYARGEENLAMERILCVIIGVVVFLNGFGVNTEKFFPNLPAVSFIIIGFQFYVLDTI